MTEQERYLITFLNETFGHHESDIDSEAFAKRLIQRYPQITKKPVKIILENEYFAHIVLPSKEQRQEWIDQHYVEVVE